MKRIILILFSFGLLGLALRTHAAEVMPPRPAHYFNDYAHLVSPSVAQTLNRKLEDFEKQTSNQVLVVIYPKMQSDSSIEDYTVRVAHKWGVGQKGRNNGLVLFVFVQDHKMYIQVGYGLEGALPDALAKTIIDQEITPKFKNKDFAGGLTAGVNAILAATKGEYKPLPQKHSRGDTDWSGFLFILIFIILFILSAWRAQSRTYTGRGRRGGWMPIFLPPMGGGGWSGGGGSWGGGGGGGGGGFSAGGGGFGGGGAGGSW